MLKPLDRSCFYDFAVKNPLVFFVSFTSQRYILLFIVVIAVLFGMLLIIIKNNNYFLK